MARSRSARKQGSPQTTRPGGDRYSKQLLDAMRQIGDPEADRVIAIVLASDGVDAFNAMMRHMEENEDLVPEALPIPVREFLVKSAALPPWAEPAQLAQGEGIFARYAPQIIVALHCASLPMCYSAYKGVQVLAMTRRLQDYTYRRVMETAQFIMDVMDPDAFSTAGRGVRSSQKIRLLHASIRYYISRDRAWNAEWGVPINQEDLAGTLTSFSACVVRALERLQITLTPTEREAFAHIWGVIGHLLGIDARVLPRSYNDTAALMDAIVARDLRACPEGQMMTKALIDYMKYMLPGNLLDGMPAVLIRHFLGDAMADVLGVEPADWTRTLLVPFRILCGISDDVTDHSSVLARLTEILGRRTLEGLCYISRGGNRYEVRIPKSTRDRWGL